MLLIWIKNIYDPNKNIFFIILDIIHLYFIYFTYNWNTFNIDIEYPLKCIYEII